jgi:uncharacterized protein (DUF885 family)
MSTDFENLASNLLEEYWRLNPVEATNAGIYRYNHALPDWGEDDQAARQNWRKQYQAALTQPGLVLNASQELDRKVALAELAYFEIEEDWQWLNRAPAFYVEEAMNGLNYLLSRPDPTLPAAEKDDQLISRLGHVPALLAQGQANLRPELVPPEFVEIGLVAARGAYNFVRTLELPMAAGVEDLRSKVLFALLSYEEFIRKDLQPGGTFATGPELFERILRQRHGLDLTPQQLYDLGDQTARELQGRLETLARRIDPSRSWLQIVEGLKADHPTRDNLLQNYRDEAANARAFVERKGLVRIPPGEVFEVRPTAPFLRATLPLGEFRETPPFSPTDNLGVLYITPVDPALPESRQQELLSAHCYTSARAICLHETFPGHHLQLWRAKLEGTPIRKQFRSTLYVEGWALYCEELMEEAGFFDTPALSLWQLKNSMWRAVRMMLDTGLHTGQLSLDAATQLLVERAGLEPNTARGENLRYTTSPTQPSSYMLGRNRIVELRKLYQARQGQAYNVSDFHDRLLAFSSVSPAFIPDSLSL